MAENLEDLKEGVVIKMMMTIGMSNTLVVAERNGIEDGQRSIRVKPVIWVNRGKWKKIPSKIIARYKPNGYYLVALPWKIKRPSILDGKQLNDGECKVLHCVRKEHPIVKFGGKVGPLSSFAPRMDINGNHVKGYYVGYHWNGEESLDEIPPKFHGRFTFEGRKQIQTGNKLVNFNKFSLLILGKL